MRPHRGAGGPGQPELHRGNGSAGFATPPSKRCAVPHRVRLGRAAGNGTRVWAGVWAPTGPTGAPAGGGIRALSGALRPRPSGACCTMGRHCGPCRRSRLAAAPGRPKQGCGPLGQEATPGERPWGLDSRARSRHSGRAQSRWQRCRTPDTCENEVSARPKTFSTQGAGVGWSPWPSNWPALASSNQVSKCPATVRYGKERSGWRGIPRI